MWKNPATNLEFALLADGVKPADVYKGLSTKEGVDRAFKKLDAIKKDIVWWEAGAQAPQILASGEVVMTTAWNGRIASANQEGKQFKIVWDNQILDSNFWVIPKGAKNIPASLEFIRFAVEPGEIVGGRLRMLHPVLQQAVDQHAPCGTGVGAVAGTLRQHGACRPVDGGLRRQAGVDRHPGLVGRHDVIAGVARRLERPPDACRAGHLVRLLGDALHAPRRLPDPFVDGVP